MAGLAIPAEAGPTTAALLSVAARRLADCGVDSARLDAEVLLARAAGASRERLYAGLASPVAKGVETAFGVLIERRCSREPLAYIVGGREFWSLWFALDRSTLIPRPETEVLVEVALEALAEMRNPVILDAGTGSGCIAVALAHERSDAIVTAIDISAAALAIARANAVRHGVGDRVRCELRDLCEPNAARLCDVVVSNPPYVRSGDLDALEPEVSRWEPRGALDGGERGLRVIRGLLANAPALVRPGGFLVVEIGSDQADEVLRLARRLDYGGARIRPDYAGRPRVLVARRTPA